MVYPRDIRENVKHLRACGKTYSEIEKELNLTIPKSTLSSWCKGITLPSWYLKKAKELSAKNLSRGRQFALTSNRIKHENLLESLNERNKYLTKELNNKNVLKMLLSFLYLGEGSKWKSHRGLILGSSDPDIIRLYIKLLNICYDIKTSVLKCRVSYRVDQNINSLQKFWSKTTGISLKNFYKTIPDPRTIGKPTKNKDYKGVCVISCKGTEKQLELELIPKIILGGL